MNLFLLCDASRSDLRVDRKGALRGRRVVRKSIRRLGLSEAERGRIVVRGVFFVFVGVFVSSQDRAGPVFIRDVAYAEDSCFEAFLHV